MNKPKCEFCLTKIENRKIEQGCVFCMQRWKDMRPEEECYDCDNNKNFTGEENENTTCM